LSYAVNKKCVEHAVPRVHERTWRSVFRLLLGEQQFAACVQQVMLNERPSTLYREARTLVNIYT